MGTWKELVFFTENQETKKGIVNIKIDYGAWPCI